MTHSKLIVVLVKHCTFDKKRMTTVRDIMKRYQKVFKPEMFNILMMECKMRVPEGAGWPTFKTKTTGQSAEL